MQTNALDARQVARPGGLGDSMTNGLKDALLAYIAFKDRQQQGDRTMRQDEMHNRQTQYRQALSDATQLGVAPTQDASGWLQPGDMAGITAAKGKFGVAEAQRLQAEKDAQVQRERGDTNWQNTLVDRSNTQRRSLLSDISSGVKKPEVSREEWNADPARGPGNSEPPQYLREQWAAEDAFNERHAAATEKSGLEMEVLRATANQKNRPPAEKHPMQDHVERELLNMKASLGANAPYTPPGGNAMPITPDKLPAYIKTFEDWTWRQGMGKVAPPDAQPQAVGSAPAKTFTKADVESAVAKRNAARQPNDMLWTYDKMAAALRARHGAGAVIE